MPDQARNIVEEARRILEEAHARLERLGSPEELERLRVRYLGRKGAAAQLFDLIGRLPAQLRPAAGKCANELKSQLTSLLQKAEQRFSEREQPRPALLDPTLPGRRPPLGSIHPLTKTIEQIAETGALEIFMNFPLMALNRTVLSNKPGALSEAQIERMNRFWGSKEWRAAIYEKKRTLFEYVEMKSYRTTGQRLGRLFKKRLEQVFPHVTDPLVMTNSKNAPLYCLILAGHDSTGAKIVREIFQRYERMDR